jgi:hypothetical protein
VRLNVNGVEIINNWTPHAATNDNGSITLVANQKYDITLQYFEEVFFIFICYKEKTPVLLFSTC